MTDEIQLYARQTVIVGGKEYHPGDELPQPDAEPMPGVDAHGQRFIRDQFGEYWRVTIGAGHPTAEHDPTYHPDAAVRVFDPEFANGLIARGLAMTDADEAAALRKIRELEGQRNAETADVVDAQLAKLRAKLP